MRLLWVNIYARLQKKSIQLALKWTELCHIKRDNR